MSLFQPPGPRGGNGCWWQEPLNSVPSWQSTGWRLYPSSLWCVLQPHTNAHTHHTHTHKHTRARTHTHARTHACSHAHTHTHTHTHTHNQRLRSISNLLLCVKRHFANLQMLSTVCRWHCWVATHYVYWCFWVQIILNKYYYKKNKYSVFSSKYMIMNIFIFMEMFHSFFLSFFFTLERNNRHRIILFIEMINCIQLN